MSRFIDKLKQLSRTEPQAIGFRTKQLATAKLKIQLVASLPQDSAGGLTDRVRGADAGLLRISRLSSSAKILENIAQTMPDIPWGGWLQGGQDDIQALTKVKCDFVVFPAATTPLASIQNDEVGKILEVEPSLTEGLLRAVNELPVDAILISSEKSYLLTWQHLMLFHRLSAILNKPVLAAIPAEVTANGLQALWEAGLSGVIVDVTAEQPQDRLKELRQMIDNLTFPMSSQRKGRGPLLPHIAHGTSTVSSEEEEEEE
ncbi:MAG: hypothetical protein HYY41_00330 [Chloroflexi bacterium]|nr:hypothetical protein [Chloroflexota bacterium]